MIQYGIGVSDTDMTKKRFKSEIKDKEFSFVLLSANDMDFGRISAWGGE